jgi:putative oxidoreductase
MKSLIKPILIPSLWQDILLSIPRIIYGYLLTVEFGAPKFGMPWSPEDKNLDLFEVVFWFPSDVAALGGVFAIFPSILAWMAGFSEAVGGLAWILGFQTRIFSFLIFVTMTVAAVCQQMQDGMWNMMPAIGFIWISIFYMVIGSGRLGIDHWVSERFFNLKK